jgi:cytochrome oxidase assembly protein ShyY1
MARHLAVLGLVVSMVLLGLWQLRRLDEKREIKAAVEAKQDQPAVPVQDALGQDDPEYVSVIAAGTYRDDDTFVVENRTFNGASGAWVLTPLALDGGEVVVVNRGFLGYDERGEIAPPPAPAGEVEVQGVVMEGERRGRFGADDPDDGTLPILARVDLEQVRELVGYDVAPIYVQRTSSTPDEGPSTPELVALGPIEPSEGPHLAYAVQWFTFTTIAAGGYLLLLRRVARDEAKEEAGAAADAAALDRELAELLDAET